MRNQAIEVELTGCRSYEALPYKRVRSVQPLCRKLEMKIYADCIGLEKLLYKGFKMKDERILLNDATDMDVSNPR